MAPLITVGVRSVPQTNASFRDLVGLDRDKDLTSLRFLSECAVR
jgi:hypothetical protein